MMENILKSEPTKAQQIIKAEPCGIARTLYLDKVYEYPQPVMPAQAHNHDQLKEMGKRASVLSPTI